MDFCCVRLSHHVCNNNGYFTRFYFIVLSMLDFFGVWIFGWQSMLFSQLDVARFWLVCFDSSGIEARGFIFGPAIALAIGAKFIPLRKPKKLPGEESFPSFACSETCCCLCLLSLLLQPSLAFSFPFFLRRYVFLSKAAAVVLNLWHQKYCQSLHAAFCTTISALFNICSIMILKYTVLIQFDFIANKSMVAANECTDIVSFLRTWKVRWSPRLMFLSMELIAWRCMLGLSNPVSVFWSSMTWLRLVGRFVLLLILWVRIANNPSLWFRWNLDLCCIIF